MSKDPNCYKNVFSIIYELFKKEKITALQKRTLKENIFKEENNIMEIIDKFGITNNEITLQEKILEYLHKEESNMNVQTAKRRPIKPHKTEIHPQKTKYIAPRLASTSKLKGQSHLKGSSTTLEQDNSLAFKPQLKSERKINSSFNFDKVLFCNFSSVSFL